MYFDHNYAAHQFLSLSTTIYYIIHSFWTSVLLIHYHNNYDKKIAAAIYIASTEMRCYCGTIAH